MIMFHIHLLTFLEKKQKNKKTKKQKNKKTKKQKIELNDKF